MTKFNLTENILETLIGLCVVAMLLVFYWLIDQLIDWLKVALT